MREFKVNRFISLKLEEDKTIIYISGERFIECKFLLINESFDKPLFNNIDSIDEIALLLNKSLEVDDQLTNQGNRVNIPPEVEFWGHCSNLQYYPTDVL